ncbi:MAG: molybdenum cofactor guanylyltransferase [Chloroflexi bacterium]|nr:molybdenum cofactor guanylyltransferase [Chloroflexota bacterium]MDA1219127.1 molybdenum cofactor guanylyltransferase [Chloroflexota bacterium]
MSAIVLAGGQSRRLGRAKALEQMGGQALICRVIERVSPLTSETIVVVAEHARSKSLPLSDSDHVALDIYPGGGSLGGIFSGLSAAKEEWGLVVACDMPFLNQELLMYLLSLREGFDAVVPVLEGRPEPTHTLYSKACLPHMEQLLKAKELRISGFYQNVRVRYVAEDDIVKIDPEFLSFFNLNTPGDLERARKLVAEGR